MMGTAQKEGKKQQKEGKKQQKEGKEQGKRKRSLRGAVMLLCAGIVVLMEFAVGGDAIFSTRTMSDYTKSTYREAVDAGYRTEIKSQVQSVIAILQGEYDKAQSGALTEEEAKEEAKEIVRMMRYRDDESGYFWIDDTEYNLVMHPVLTDQEGQNRRDLEDQNGVMIVQEIMKVCQSDEKGGYNEFAFTKADGKTVAPKVAYSQLFEPWGWVVSTGNYVDDMQADMAEVEDKISDTATDMLLRTDTISALAIIVALVISFVFGTRMVKPLKEIQGFAKKMSEGDLTGDIKVNSSNEIGQTADLLNIAQHNMEKLLHDILDVAEGVKGSLTKFDDAFGNMKVSIGQTSDAVNSIAGNVSEQASSTDNAADEVNVMAERIASTDEAIKVLNDNADNMKHLSEQSMETLGNLSDVNEKARQNITAMYRQTEATNQAVKKIEIAANLINEIADQTNLLALNANIEAARAGESGRGFAVVADEIGELARQSTSSVEEIRKVIEELMKNTEKSVQIMEEINQSLDVQTDSMDETRHAFEELYQELDSCVVAVRSIDTMTGEIEKQRANVTQSLGVLNDLAQNNAAVAQETSAMTGELSGFVDNSNQIVLDLDGKVKTLLRDIEKFRID